jgi:hypothetical protein
MFGSSRFEEFQTLAERSRDISVCHCTGAVAEAVSGHEVRNKHAMPEYSSIYLKL